MKNIAICDDINEICNQIELYINDFCKEYSNDFFVYKVNHAKDLYSLLEDKTINLLFLDIELPEINGVEIGNYIRKKIKDDEMQIVYVSAKEDYYRELFDIRPMNFLEKPFTKEEIYYELKEWLRLSSKERSMFSYKIGQDTFFQKVDDILYFEIVGKKIKMVTTSFEAQFYESLDNIQKELGKYYFVSVHKSYLINMTKIDKYASKEVLMQNGKTITVSRSKKDGFLKSILAFEKNKLFTNF